MFGLGFWELIVILVIVLLLFGARKLPEVGSGIGAGIKNFKNAIKNNEDDKEEKKNSDGSSSC
ncbi:MAG: twin-arginine translocase TatA/TatE family subunit [Syntrophorhabdaceae bacterium]|nr:twin-arginine translocase TatA/TatE family subunit [Syntrophorhabdaceae bacterium]